MDFIKTGAVYAVETQKHFKMNFEVICFKKSSGAVKNPSHDADWRV